MSDFDADEWAKEDCTCGHRRSTHLNGVGGCTRTIQTADYTGLPEPEYAEGDEGNPLAWPVNWPHPSDVPVHTVACTCKQFSLYEVEEP